MNLNEDQWNHIGANCSENGRFGAAIECFHKALHLQPRRHDIRANLVDNLRRSWRFDEALEEMKRASADGWFDKLTFIAGCLYHEIGETDKALEYFTPRICTTPYGRFCRSQSLLHAGRYAEGWEWHESRLEMGHPGNPPIPMWKGEPLNGKRVAIHHEQGYGDTLAYVRFLKHMDPDSYVLGLPSALIDLFPNAISTNAPLQGVDYYLPLMSLPHVLSLSGPTIETPYIKPVGKFDIPRSQDTKLKVGIVWRSKAGHTNEVASVAIHGMQKSIPLESLLPLTGIPGVQLYSLQAGGQDDIKKLGADYLILDLASKIITFRDLALFIQEMDLIVSVDTAPLHLAGAMGTPSIGLLSCRGGWPFPGLGETTEWYPGMKLIRQPTPHDWGGVVQKLRSHIQGLVSTN